MSKQEKEAVSEKSSTPALPMKPSSIKRLARERFLSLRTYRKNGEAVDTPVWTVAHEGELLVFTPSDSGKLKRIANNAHVQVAPCGRFGAVQGKWVDGMATIDNTVPMLDRAYILLQEKLGLEFQAYRLVLGDDWHDKRTVIRITPR